MRDAFRICATCRHLEISGQGVEFPGIADTEYMVFHCRRLGWTSREDYLMAPIPESLPGSSENPVCPYWEAPVRDAAPGHVAPGS